MLSKAIWHNAPSPGLYQGTFFSFFEGGGGVAETMAALLIIYIDLLSCANQAHR